MISTSRILLVALATVSCGLLSVPVAQAQEQAPQSAPAADASRTKTGAQQLAQTSPTDPTLPTAGEAATLRPGINYIGAGLNVGLGGDEGDPLGGATVGGIVGKVRVLNLQAVEVSFRPTILLATDSQVLLSGTIDFIQAGQSRTVVPYIGAGASLGTGGNNSAFLLTAGGDIRLAEAITGFAQVNAGFFTESTGVSLLLGAGYNF